MARRFYDTSQRIFSLFKKHPAMSSLLDEFLITNEDLKNVCDFLIANDQIIQNASLAQYYDDTPPGNSIVNQLANLYNQTVYVGGPPWSTFESPRGTKLTELLYFTLYYYKFAVTDNFYETHILEFVPEYDREQITQTPKLKLSLESLGRKLDDIEDKITRMFELIDIDKCPDEILDYLGQNLGYEKEDFTLSNVSFRELLKNIIDIYKVKGTNYSFTFFFKFLGFVPEIKEFYFNRDVQNPQSFPGADLNKVEYFLTITNPLFEKKYTGPHKLGQIRNLDDWADELSSFILQGCSNSSAYMRGDETYNQDQITWHPNPWTYFKTNLIEYQLNPFIDPTKFSLTAQDNETIKKYIRFLSPTYLFTWINVNLASWIETFNLSVVDSNSKWKIEINQNMGDVRPTPDGWQYPVKINPPGPYRDYEPVGDYLFVFKTDSNDRMENDTMSFSIDNLMSLNGNDNVGTYLKHDGMHVRQPGNPKFIADAYHRAINRLALEKLSIELSIEGGNIEDYSARPYPAIPVYVEPSDETVVINTANLINFNWEAIEGQTAYSIQSSPDRTFASNLIVNQVLSSNQTSYVTPSLCHNDRYYWRVKTQNNLPVPSWGPWNSTTAFTLNSYPFPFEGEIIDCETLFVKKVLFFSDYKANLALAWNSIPNALSYQVHVSLYPGYTALVIDQETRNPWANVTLEFNDIGMPWYYWHYRAKDRDTGWGLWLPSDLPSYGLKFSISL